MQRRNSTSWLWQSARIETGTLAILVLACIVANVLGWLPKVNSSVAVLGIYALWLAVCVVVYRYFYRLDN